MARPLKGKTKRQIVAIRLDDEQKKYLIKVFGSVQKAVDSIFTRKEK